MNPRHSVFDCSSWHWNTQLVVFPLKVKATVLLAGSIVHKDNSGKIEEWNISSSNSTGALYIIAQDTITDVDRGVCIYAGEVSISALKYPTDVSWVTAKSGVSILDSMNLRSQITLRKNSELIPA